MTIYEVRKEIKAVILNKGINNILNKDLNEIHERTGAALGLTYNPISNKKGSKRPTVKEFAKSHPTGRYIVKVAHHVVAVVDGVYYDTWDSGYKSLYGYYEVKGV